MATSDDASVRKAKVLVTGVGGVVGRAVVDQLDERNLTFSVLTRNPDKLAEHLPTAAEACGYGDMTKAMCGVDAVIHLAALNNDSTGTREEFYSVNVDLTVRLAEAARKAGASRFVFASSTKAIDGTDHYSETKRVAEARLSLMNSPQFRVIVVRLPPVYGAGLRGKLRHLTGLPSWLQPYAYSLLRSLTPIVSADRAAKALVGSLFVTDPLEENCIADPLENDAPYWLFSKSLDVAFAIAVPTLLLIPLAGASLAVALTSEGGVFFVQERVGRHEQLFRIRKFRTMVAATPNAGSHEVDESYLTDVGKLLRLTKLDELPQAWNVAQGDISLVGPRPCLATQSELLHQRRRYGVFGTRPGITGYGQVNGVDMSQPLELAIQDHRYARLRSVKMDLSILLKTVTGSGFGDALGNDKPGREAESQSVPGRAHSVEAN